jgi:CRP-like cAMP-binding protein
MQLRRLGEYDLFGELGVIKDTGRSCSMIAETKVDCYGMSKGDFMKCEFFIALICIASQQHLPEN